ncbi:hypothetical protein ACCO45_003877 [Purpureocillium lilacinum]|uniref:Uncharacterized protein n=1 Tax=Purpureocillium lilacinum TaxID=33203 RepID=A0ACC4E3M9_PURLI
MQHAIRGVDNLGTLMETTPLLADSHRHSTKSPQCLSRAADSPPPAKDKTVYCRRRSPQVVILLLSFNIFCVTAVESLIAALITRLLEDILCRRYYALSPSTSAEGPVEQTCKVVQIQSQLAWLTAMLKGLDAVVECRIGRRPVYGLSYLGTMLGLAWKVAVLRFFPLHVYAILLSPAFQVIGGGPGVSITMEYLMAVDVLTAESRHVFEPLHLSPDRCEFPVAAFLRMGVSSYVGHLVASFVSARLMQSFSPWPPILVALVLFPLGVSVACLFLPETLKTQDAKSRKQSSPNSSINAGSERVNQPTSAFGFRDCLARLGQALSIVKKPSALLLLLSFISKSPSAYGFGAFMVQYIIQKDLLLARFSMCCWACGFFLVAGPTVRWAVAGQVIITLGDGFVSFCRSTIITFIDPQQASTLYTLVNIVETVGACAAGPALAWLFSTGMKLGNDWDALPYLGLAGLCAFIAVMMAFVRLPSESEEGESTEG